MRVRSAEPDDAEAIHRVTVAACRAAYADILEDAAFREPVDDPDRTEALRRRLARTSTVDSVVYLVAESGGSVVGFVQVRYGESRPERVDSGVAYLKSLYVRPDSWNEGVGSTLLAEGLDRVPASVGRVRLRVLAANDRGKRFYERRGFERVDTGAFDVDGTTYGTETYVRDRS